MIEPLAARPEDLVHEVSNFLTICLTTGRLAAEARGPLPAPVALEQILERAEELCLWIEAARPSLLANLQAPCRNSASRIRASADPDSPARRADECGTQSCGTLL